MSSTSKGPAAAKAENTIRLVFLSARTGQSSRTTPPLRARDLSAGVDARGINRETHRRALNAMRAAGEIRQRRVGRDVWYTWEPTTPLDQLRPVMGELGAEWIRSSASRGLLLIGTQPYAFGLLPDASEKLGAGLARLIRRFRASVLRLLDQEAERIVSAAIRSGRGRVSAQDVKQFRNLTTNLWRRVGAARTGVGANAGPSAIFERRVGASGDVLSLREIPSQLPQATKDPITYLPAKFAKLREESELGVARLEYDELNVPALLKKIRRKERRRFESAWRALVETRASLCILVR